MNITEQKNILRNKYKLKIKKFIQSHNKTEINNGIKENINSLLSSHLQSAKKIGVYSPLVDEVDWTLALDNQQFILGFPVIDKSERIIQFFEYTGEKNLSQLGISLGADECGSLLDPDVVLVPALAFDENGYRLGRGGGFYDRYLKNFKGLKIGIVYSCSLNGELPRIDHDIPVDYIVTEQALYCCK